MITRRESIDPTSNSRSCVFYLYSSPIYLYFLHIVFFSFFFFLYIEPLKFSILHSIFYSLLYSEYRTPITMLGSGSCVPNPTENFSSLLFISFLYFIYSFTFTSLACIFFLHFLVNLNFNLFFFYFC